MNLTHAARAAPAAFETELHPVAVTALLYLKEAVRRERYEDCAAYVAAARDFGAPAVEIQGVLDNPRRSLKAQRAAHALGFN